MSIVNFLLEFLVGIVIEPRLQLGQAGLLLTRHSPFSMLSAAG
jgi:hypothetical protein